MNYNPTVPKNQQIIALIGSDRTTYTMLSICNLQGRKIIEFKNGADLISGNEKQQLNIVAIISQGEIMSSAGISLLESLGKKKFQKIPFFLVCKEIDLSICKLALRGGITDIFTLPINIPNLEKRINFMIDNWGELNITHKSQKQRAYTVPFSTRIFDLITSIFALIILSPLFLLIFLFIKIGSKGPAIYGSLRVGSDYKIFKQFKFRSTNLDPETGSADFETYLNCKPTSFGKVLRSSKLNELPQLWNVFKGEMSIVGNAPLPLFQAEKLTTDKYVLRFRAPAGITGLWQVEKRFSKGIITEEGRWILDANYAQNQSFMTDMQVFLRSFTALFRKGSGGNL